MFDSEVSQEQRQEKIKIIGQRAPYHYLGNGRALTYLHTGQPFYVATDDEAIAPWIIMAGRWETYADDIVSDYVKPGMVVVDAGANMGYYSTKWGQLVGETGRLYAFEANPVMARLAQSNLRLNALTETCEVRAIALGDGAGDAVLTCGTRDAGMGTLRSVPSDLDAATFSVKVETLDHLLSHIQKIDLLKIDVEGFEPQVIAGAAELLARSPKCAIHVEAQVGWSDYRPFDQTLAAISSGRCIFVLRKDKVLMPIDFEQVEPYLVSQPTGMCDLFLCPPDDIYLDRIRSFMGR